MDDSVSPIPLKAMTSAPINITNAPAKGNVENCPLRLPIARKIPNKEIAEPATRQTHTFRGTGRTSDLHLSLALPSRNHKAIKQGIAPMAEKAVLPTPESANCEATASAAKKPTPPIAKQASNLQMRSMFKG